MGAPRSPFRSDWTLPVLAVALVALLAGRASLPDWLSFLFAQALAKFLVVASVMILMRAGLVSFGQGLYYCLGGYTVGVAGELYGIRELAILLPLAVLVSAGVAAVLGLLLSRYRDIFFAMFTLAFSMILYGLIVKTSALGSTDGFNIVNPTFFGYAPPAEAMQIWLFWLTAAVAFLLAMLVHAHLKSPLGFAAEAVRENEVRVSYLGRSPRLIVYLRYIYAAKLAGLGGALTALIAGHVDPEMAYWTTSGEFVFVSLLSGIEHIAAVIVGSVLFELVRTYAFELAPYTWQMILGGVLLVIILFLPRGLWSLVTPARRVRG